MQTTRKGILEILKRKGSATVTDLASALKVTPMGIRQHLGLLERDGLVTYAEVRRKTGRPHYSYQLTSQAEEVFPKNYHNLTLKILEEMRLTEGDEKVRLIFHGMAGRLSAALADQLAGSSEDEKVAKVVALLNEEGALAEWETTGSSFLVHGYNCPYYRVATSFPQICEMESVLLSGLFAGKVEQTACLLSGDGRCSFKIERIA